MADTIPLAGAAKIKAFAQSTKSRITTRCQNQLEFFNSSEIVAQGALATFIRLVPWLVPIIRTLDLCDSQLAGWTMLRCWSGNLDTHKQ